MIKVGFWNTAGTGKRPNIHTVSYIWQKGSIAGPNWKIPFVGPFFDSINPKMDKYKAQWASGELSCVSVFHK